MTARRRAASRRAGGAAEAGPAQVGGYEQVTLGVAVTNQTAGTLVKPDAVVAISVGDPFSQLIHDGPSAAVAQSASPISARQDWINPANAQGAANATLASIAGNAAGPRGGTLTFTYATQPARNDLTLDVAQLRFHVRQQATALNNGDLRLEWRPTATAAWTTLETIAGNVDSLAAPRSFSILGGAITDWPHLSAVQARVIFESALGELQTADVDAVILHAEGADGW